MAHLEYSNVSHEACLMINKDEAKILLPFIKRCLNAEKKQEDKYQDIHDSGEATDRQETMLMKQQNKVCTLDSIIRQIELLMKP